MRFFSVACPKLTASGVHRSPKLTTHSYPHSLLFKKAVEAVDSLLVGFLELKVSRFVIGYDVDVAFYVAKKLVKLGGALVAVVDSLEHYVFKGYL